MDNFCRLEMERKTLLILAATIYMGLCSLFLILSTISKSEKKVFHLGTEEHSIIILNKNLPKPDLFLEYKGLF